MSALDAYDYNKLLHDVKRIGKCIQIIQDEENPEKRKIIGDLSRAEVDRLYSDIEEMKEVEKNDNKKEK